MACDLSFIVKSEVLIVTGSYIHLTSGIISETVLDRGIVTTNHKQEVIYGVFNSSSCADLGCTLKVIC